MYEVRWTGVCCFFYVCAWNEIRCIKEKKAVIFCQKEMEMRMSAPWRWKAHVVEFSRLKTTNSSIEWLSRVQEEIIERSFSIETVSAFRYHLFFVTYFHFCSLTQLFAFSSILHFYEGSSLLTQKNDETLLARNLFTCASKLPMWRYHEKHGKLETCSVTGTCEQETSFPQTVLVLDMEHFIVEAMIWADFQLGNSR